MGSLKTAANRITNCRAADYTMITMRVECAIGVEPMNSTLCRRPPWPLGYAHLKTNKVAWDGFEPSRGLLQGQVGYRLPHQAKRVGEGGFLRKLRPRGSKPLTLTRLRYSPMVVAALATGTTRAATRERNKSSSESKRDDGSPRSSHDTHLRTTVDQFLTVTGVCVEHTTCCV